MEYEEPFGMSPVIEVDTRQQVDVEGLAESVKKALSGSILSED